MFLICCYIDNPLLNRLVLGDVMCDSYSLVLNLKIGIVKELHKRELISDAQMKKVLKIIINQDSEKMLRDNGEKCLHRGEMCQDNEKMLQDSEKIRKGANEKCKK